MTGRRAVVVGYDGSGCSRTALARAVDEARHRNLPLKIVYGLGWLVYGPPAPTGELLAATDLRFSAERVIAGALEQVSRQAPDLEVSSKAYVEVSGGAALVEESAAAEMIVVGSHGRGGFKGLLLGSTSTTVAMHAHCPVIVVRTPPADVPPGPAAGRVVVGVDGSDLSADAVEFAFAAADARRVGLTAVHTWASPWTPGIEGLPYTAGELATMCEREAVLTAESLAGWSAKYPDVSVRQVLREGSASAALVEHSAGAELVVVGSRGHGGFIGLLLGSVSQALVHHASCPVAVVHRRGDSDAHRP